MELPDFVINWIEYNIEDLLATYAGDPEAYDDWHDTMRVKVWLHDELENNIRAGVIKAQVIHVRSLPSCYSEAEILMEYGDVVQIFETKGWYSRIGKNAWVHSSWIGDIEPITSGRL